MKKAKLTRSETHYGQRVILIALAKLAVYTKQKRGLKNKSNQIAKAIKTGLKSQIYQVLCQYKSLKQNQRVKQTRAADIFNRSKKRLVMYCLLQHRQQ